MSFPSRVLRTALCALALLPAGEAQAAGVADEVTTALALNGAVCACIELEDTSDRTQPLRLRSATFSKLQDQILAQLPQGSVHVRYRYRYSPVLVADLFAAQALQILGTSTKVTAVKLNDKGAGGLVESRQLIRANDATDLGFTGHGTTVAMLDSGIDTNHPDFEGAVIHQYHFLREGQSVGRGAEDGHGHGTHTTGICASRGKVSQPGIASEALIVSIKVLDNSNSGFLCDWAAGVEHVIQLHETQDNGIRVDAINMSLVSFAQFSGLCDAAFPAFSNATTAAKEAGIAVFASSGNNSSTTHMTSPACFTDVISVGSTPDVAPEVISSFTSRNELLDLVAPGESITSTTKGGSTRVLSGTSMSCPHAVGTACLLRQAHPTLSVDDISRILKETGTPVFDSLTGHTFPRVDALGAVTSLPTDPRFVRGDANATGEVDIADAIRTISLVLLRTDLPNLCNDAVDANDSGGLDLSDAIYLLNYIFVAGPAVPDPGVARCGFDRSQDEINCEAYAVCP